MKEAPTGHGALVVHFNDVRLLDNRALVEAYRHHESVVSVVVIDPGRLRETAFGIPRYSARRILWFLDAVHDLRRSYRARGGELLVRVGDTVSVLQRLVARLQSVAVYGQDAKTEDETRMLRRIEEGLQDTPCHWAWNDVLVAPQEWPVPAWSFPRSFTGFRKKFEALCTVSRPADIPTLCAPPMLEPGEIPALEELGFTGLIIDPRSPITPLRPGESGAWRQLEAYVWQEDRLRHYKSTRNGMNSWSDSSKLSPYLALGLISPASVFHEVLRYEEERVRNDSTYWLRFELLWREYFHALALSCGNTLFHRRGVSGVHTQWSTDRAAFERWTDGRTGCPLVDACMRELSETGFSSNRARQIAASFLTRYMRVDWRWGAAWFEHHLLDHDPCSNWGNWQYVAGVGTGPKDRVMSIRRQAERYDAAGDFTRRWVSEARGLSGTELTRCNPWGPDDWGRPSHSYAVEASASGHYPG